jgi:regulatory protein
MPRITDIKQQKRSKGRFSVYVDGTYSFSLGDLELSMSGLNVGQELTDAEIEQYREQGEEAVAYHKALGFIGIRPRSEWEMREYLLRKEYVAETVEEVLGQLKKVGLLDDLAFAQSWVANRQVLKPSSRRRLEQELMAKRVGKEEISAALDGLDDDGELVSLVGQMEKKRRLVQYQDREKLIGYFGRQGYGYDLIKKALERLE